MTRALAVVLAVVAALMIGTTAAADVIVDETFQAATGTNAAGDLIPKEDLTEDQTYDIQDAPRVRAGWRLFLSTKEGQRILRELEKSDIKIRLRVTPIHEIPGGSELLEDGKNALGKAEWDYGTMPFSIDVYITPTSHKSVPSAAQVFYHEFRHAELYLLDDPSQHLGFKDGHDELHAGTDPGLLKFRKEVGINLKTGIPLPNWTPPTTTGPSTTTTPPPSTTVAGDVESGDDVAAGDGSSGESVAVDDPIGDWEDSSGNAVAAGAMPAQWDIIRYERQGTRHTAVLAGDCSQQCLSELQIASAQLIARRADGGVEATVILQMNDQGRFDQSTNGNPALVVNTAEFAGSSFVFDADGSGLPDGITFEVAVRGSRSDSIDDGGSDIAGPIPNT